MRKTLAQEPVLFDEEKSQSTATNFEDFLKNSRGFYNARVIPIVSPVSRYLTDVNYEIKAGRRYTINSITYEIADTAVEKIVLPSLKDSYLVAGDPVNSTNYDLEKIRITNLLQNNGYAAFNHNNFELLGDSSDYRVDLKLLIKNPRNKFEHEKYYVGTVNVFTDFYLGQNLKKLDSISINGISIFKELNDYIIKPEIIENTIAIIPGELFSKEKINETYTRLSRFSVYKFISVKTSIDTLNSVFVNYDIQMFVNDFRVSWEGGANLKYLMLSAGQNYINTGLNGIIHSRILSDRGDNLTFDGSGDLRINLSDGSYQELIINSKLDYSYPNISPVIKLTPINLYNKFIIRQDYDNLKTNVVSNVSFAFNHLQILYNFQISSFDFNFGHNYFSRRDGVRMFFNQTGINYLTAEIYDEALFNDFQRRSLNSFFQTGLLFKQFFIEHRDIWEKERFRVHTLLGLELSGAELFLANKSYNYLFKNKDIWKINENVSFAKFLKANIDFRPKYLLNRNDEIASRIYAGIGLPFGDSESIPYLKQFEAGGPTSMRAWAARSLGPGSFVDTLRTADQFPYQKGDIRLEANIEYRFRLSSYFRSALFLDAGNVWTLKEDPDRPGAQFTRDFYRQIAVNAGFSIQLDVFLLLRFDFAFKIRNPYKGETGSYLAPNPFKPTFVFSINNPF